MNVLVGGGNLIGIGGSENYSYTIIHELHKRGINVDGFSATSNGKPLLSKKIKELGVKLYVETPPTKKYDLILSSNKTTVEPISFVDGFRIHTFHGIHVNEEQPWKVANLDVSISEETQSYLEQTYNITSHLIRNGVDSNRFNVTQPINKTIKNVLSLAHSGELNHRLENIFDKLGINFIYKEKINNTSFNVEDYINDADLVITVGRGVYEAMSCGRVVLILDDRKYVGRGSIGDGIVTDKNIDYFIQNNCSGRYTNKVFTDDDIINELSKYDYRLGEFGRDYVQKHLTIEQSVDKYLELYEQFR